MKLRLLPRRIAARAPVTAGAVFCVIFALASCRRERAPAWDELGSAPPPAGESAPETAAAAPAEKPAPEPAAEPVGPTSKTAAAASGKGFRFINYNVENWLTMDRFVDGERVTGAPKPDSDKQAVIRILSRARPDVIGLCEVGQAADLAEIQSMLKAAGVDLPHSHHSGGGDSVRFLGLLSRYPLVATAEPAELDYRLNGKTFTMGRGVLDATVERKGKPYRFLGAHLKSKREVEEGDQEQMRINEARLLRRHVDSILAADGGARLIVYGDFNDTRPSRSFRTITGNYNDPGYLTAIPFKDSRGHAWSHHWRPHDIYSRIDFVTVTRPLRTEVDFQASHILDDAEWEQASDHRAQVAIFR